MITLTPVADTLERVVKCLERVVEKADSDYAGDHTRVIDLVRATGRFDTPARLADALETLLDPPGDSDAPAMRIVRCKDKFNNPRDGCVARAGSRGPGGLLGFACHRV